jgi:hypothetical protein
MSRVHRNKSFLELSASYTTSSKEESLREKRFRWVAMEQCSKLGEDLEEN